MQQKADEDEAVVDVVEQVDLADVTALAKFIDTFMVKFNFIAFFSSVTILSTTSTPGAGISTNSST